MQIHLDLAVVWTHDEANACSVAKKPSTWGLFAAGFLALVVVIRIVRGTMTLLMVRTICLVFCCGDEPSMAFFSASL